MFLNGTLVQFDEKNTSSILNCSKYSQPLRKIITFSFFFNKNHKKTKLQILPKKDYLNYFSNKTILMKFEPRKSVQYLGFSSYTKIMIFTFMLLLEIYTYFLLGFVFLGFFKGWNFAGEFLNYYIQLEKIFLMRFFSYVPERKLYQFLLNLKFPISNFLSTKKFSKNDTNAIFLGNKSLKDQYGDGKNFINLLTFLTIFLLGVNFH